jgi:hypothetical protein
LQTVYPGVGLAGSGREWRVTVPDALRIGHDARFAQLTRRFLDHVEHRRRPASWEKRTPSRNITSAPKASR